MFFRRPGLIELRALVCAAYLVVLAGCGGGSKSTAPPPAPVTSAPSPLANVAAVAGNQTVALNWSASADATGYKVKRATVSGGPYALLASISATSYVDSAVTNGTAYYYVVSAVNASGESQNSTPATATPVAPPAPVVASVTVTVSPAVTHPISPYVYGVNIAGASDAYPAGTSSSLPADLMLNRSGGNRLTAYNWENNASNAGSDWHYQNDALMGNSTVPGSAMTDAITSDRDRGMASLITLQVQGLVAADTNGPVSVANPPDLSRFKSVVYQKSSVSSTPFTLSPPVNDANVYMDEFLWAIDQRFPGQGILGSTPASQPVFVQLDNEPELWNSTHLEIQGSTLVSSDSYIAKTIGLATALKSTQPGVKLLGPAHYGFFGLYAWQGELAPSPGGENWFTDKYLKAIKSASDSFGKPLVDIYDFHWYSEATDGSNRIAFLNGATLTDAQVQAIVQSPRSLWDPTYREDSWVANSMNGPIYLLPRLRAKISTLNPGMGLAITEYFNGGARHIAGTIAQADNLGVFGSQGLFAANYWPLTSDSPYTLAGFRAFRNFDGAHHHFGDISVQAASSDVSKVAAYVSTDTTRPGRVVIVAINRSNSTQVTTISGMPLTGTARLFQMTAATAAGQGTVQPVAAGTQAISGASLTLTLPPLSVTTVDSY